MGNIVKCRSQIWDPPPARDAFGWYGVPPAAVAGTSGQGRLWLTFVTYWSTLLFIYFDRNFKLAKFQYKHKVENDWTEDGYNFHHLLVTLEHQKGQQSKLSKEVDLQSQFSFHEKCKIWLTSGQYCPMQVTDMKSTPSLRCLWLIWSSTCGSGWSFFAS